MKLTVTLLLVITFAALLSFLGCTRTPYGVAVEGWMSVRALCQDGADDIRMFPIHQLSPAEMEEMAARLEKTLCGNRGVFHRYPRRVF